MKITFISIICLLLASCKHQETPPSSNYTDLISSLPSNPDICTQNQNSINYQAILDARCNWLSDYNLFDTLNSNETILGTKGFSYEINSELFTDFANKSRYIFLPENQSITFNSNNHFTFPVGTVLVKIFSLDSSESSKMIEVRLGIKKENGWTFLPYIWVEDREDAFFYREGLKLATSVQANSDYIDFTYEIPNSTNCLECHRNEFEEDVLSFHPIGPKARHLNKNVYLNGETLNQLTYWQNKGYLTGLPNDINTIDTAPNWKDTTADIQNRAKAYLDINCAHCHSEGGTAALSGLRLEYWRKSIGHTHGVCNSSHGWRGGGFDIWPGQGEISSIPIRMRHTEPKDRMPPIGRSLVDEAAAQLISDWIDTLPYEECAN